jgi:hypothetical protein
MASYAQILEEIANVVEAAESGQLSAEQQAMVNGYLAELDAQKREKIDGIAQFFRLSKDSISAKMAESKRLARRAKSEERSRDYMMEHVLGQMQAAGEKKIYGNAYTISIHSTPVVRIDNESAIPAQYWREKVERSVDKVAIRDAIKAGQNIAGASMGESISLQVR